MKIHFLSFVCRFGWAALFGATVGGEPLHGPNVNPSNLAVLVEWEAFTGRQADIIGDNFSADSWAVFREAPTFREEGPKGALAEQLRRWHSAFDGDGVLSCAEGGQAYLGSPRGPLSDYELEFAIPMFPNRLTNEAGELVSSTQVGDRWEMGEPGSRHHREAKRAFQALAAALVSAGMGEARIRLGWEFTGDWFPWSIDPEGGATMGTATQFKACWKFIYLTMEQVNPKFTWVWCGTVGFDHFDPSAAFPEYPGETFLDQDDQADKLLVDFVSADIYDSDGESYYRPDDPEKDDFELTPGYWNTRDEERQAAFDELRAKLFEGKGHLAGDGESTTYGLRFFKELADRKGLPFAVSEWGPWANYVPARQGKKSELLRSPGFGGDDNPEFIAGFFDWTRKNEVGYSILFEFYNGGEGDTVDHTLLPGYWNSSHEGRPRLSLYPQESSYSKVTDQLHPRAAKAYLEALRGKDASDSSAVPESE